MARREFTKSVKIEITKRATHNGVTRCEECHCAIAKWEIHHKDEDAMQTDKTAKLTADDGLLLCIPCHKEATKAFMPVIAKVKRIEAKHMGADIPAGLIKSPGFAKREKIPKRLSTAKALPPPRMFEEIN